MSLSLGVFYCCHVCLSVTRSHCMSYLHLIGQFHSVLRSAGGLIKRPARGQLLFVRTNKLKLLFTQHNSTGQVTEGCGCCKGFGSAEPGGSLSIYN